MPNLPMMVATRATVTTVASSTNSATLLAANGSRIGAVISNSDANPLFIRIGGGTASASDFSVVIPTNSTYTVPFAYNGAISGIWGTDGAGHAGITEYTA